MPIYGHFDWNTTTVHIKTLNTKLGLSKYDIAQVISAPRNSSIVCEYKDKNHWVQMKNSGLLGADNPPPGQYFKFTDNNFILQVEMGICKLSKNNPWYELYIKDLMLTPQAPRGLAAAMILNSGTYCQSSIGKNKTHSTAWLWRKNH